MFLTAPCPVLCAHKRPAAKLGRFQVFFPPLYYPRASTPCLAVHPFVQAHTNAHAHTNVHTAPRANLCAHPQIRTATVCQVHADTQPQPPRPLLQLSPCQDPAAAEGAAAGAEAAAFPAHSGLVVTATASDHGHPELPRGVAATTVSAKNALSAPWDPTSAETSRELSSSLIPRWGLADGEWPDPTGRPQRAGTDPCQHLQEDGCVPSAYP